MKNRLLPQRRASKKRRQKRKPIRSRKLSLPELLEAKQMLAADVLTQVPIGTVGDAVRDIELTFSAPLMGDSAREQANYQLTHLGDDGVIGGEDDTAIPVLPQYVDGSTMLRLSTLADLSAWTEVDYAFPQGIFGDWQLSPETGSVQQTLNGAPTFFVSDSPAGVGEFRSQLVVDVSTDDDYVGIVFGFEQDATTELPESYFVLSWKRIGSGGAAAGLTLAKVEGTGQIGERPDLWRLDSSDPHITILAESLGTSWTTENPYEISVEQGLDSFTLTVRDGVTGNQIWQTSAANIDGLGRVGFYNFSQAGVRHWATETSNSLPLGAYEIRVTSGGVLDSNGDAIDGDNDGLAGGDFVGQFEIVESVAPTVVSVTPSTVTNQSISQIGIELSEPVVGDDARSPSIYQLTSLGADGMVGGGDDRLVSVIPTYADGTTDITLATVQDERIDLSLWQELDYSNGSAGDWRIEDAGSSVKQYINGHSTFFVSDFEFIDSTFTGRLRVETTGDDDYVGLVFGFDADVSSGQPDSYYFFSWKQGDQSDSWGFGEAGMKLLKVSGTGAFSESSMASLLWDGENGPNIEVLARNTASNLGWQDNVEYDFSVSYTTDGQISLSIRNSESGVSLWETSLVDPSPLGIGKVGFLNLSQGDVRYSGLDRSEVLRDGAYRLVVTSGEPGLRNPTGTALDGNADNVPGGDFIYNFTIDQTPPTVAGVTLTSNSLTIAFNEAIGMDEASVRDVANYMLTSSGGDGTLGDGADLTVDLATLVSGIAFDAASKTATLTFPSSLPDEQYELTVLAGGVQDSGGNALGGGVDHVQQISLIATSTVVTVDLQSASDSGAFDTDNITNVTSPSFDVTVNKPGLIEVFVDNDAIPEFTTLVTQPGTVSFTALPLADENYDIRARLTPAAGSVGESNLAVAIDTIGPHLLEGSATEQAPVYTRTVVFNEAIDELATAAGVVVTLTDPNNQSVSFSGLPTGSGDTYIFSFAPLILPGDYTLSANTSITDLAGNLIDQDQDGTGGEVGQDEPIDAFEVLADTTNPFVVQFDPLGVSNENVSELQVKFSEAINTTSFDVGDVAVIGPAGVVDLTGAVITANSDRTFAISIPTLTDEGEYTVSLGTTITDLSDNVLASAFLASFTIDKTGPRVLSALPAGEINGIVDHIDITFSEPLESSSFTAADISLIGPAGAITIGQPQKLSDAVYRIAFPPQQANGQYSLSVGPDVLDFAGNAMDQDANGIVGELTDAFQHNISIALPDLLVQNPVTPSKLTFDFGESINVGWTVLNDGEHQALGAITDKVWLSTNDQLSADDVLLASVDLASDGPVAIGEAYAGTASVVVPLDGQRTPGTYYLIVDVDSGHAIAESNEGNNQRAVTVELVNPPLPDLIAQSITTTDLLLSGETVTLNWQIDNVGSEIATGPWTERVYISNSADGSDRQLLQSFVYSDSLAPADTPIDRIETMDLPLTSLSGDIFFFVEVDATNNVVETNEDNLFVSAGSYSVPSLLTFALAASTAIEGGASVQATLTRNGDVSQPLVVSLTPSKADQLNLPATVTIAAGQYTKRFNIAAANDDAFDGDVQVVVNATAPGYPSSAAILTAIDNDQPTLVLSLPVTELAEGGLLTATVTREVPAATDLIINIASSDDAQLDAPLAVVLPQGETSVTFQLTAVDDTLVERAASYAVNVTATGHVGDSEVVTIPQNDVPTLGLAVPGMLAEGSVGPTVLGTITRDVATDRDLIVELASADAALVSVPATVTILAGQTSATFPIQITDDGDVNGDRSVDVTARVRPTASGTPFDEGADTATVQVLDNDGEALTITIARDTVAEGKTVAATIRRNTVDVSQPLTVTLTSDDLTELTAPATVEIPIGAQTVDVTLSGLEDDEIDGDQIVTLTAAADGFNTGTGSVIVVDINQPDLVITSLEPDRLTAFTGDSIDTSWRIENLGFAPAEGTWTQRVFISSDANIGNDTLAGQYTFTGPLGEAQGYERSAPIQLPNAPGNYWIVLETDIAGTVAEGLETNNSRITSLPIVVDAAYTATVMTDVEMAPADTSVLLTGSATNTADGTPAAFKQVSVHIEVRGTKRILPAITDANGNYQTTFNPLPGEGGSYTVGATFPGITNAAVQDSFKLVGMRAEPPNDSIRVKEGDPAKNDSVLIRNLADVELTNLQVELLDMPANLQVTATFDPDISVLPEMGTVTLNYSVAATDPSIQSGTFRLRVTSAESPDVIVPVSFRVVPLVSRLVAAPGSLSKSMLVGDQTSVEFTIENTGGLGTGPLSVLLPSGADWLTLATPANIPSLEPGGTTSVTLLLTPAESLALTAYNGSLVVRGDTTQVSVPFSFRAVSEETGDLEITVTDEFFYFTDEKPLVTDATVRLLDAITGELIASSDDATPASPAGGITTLALAVAAATAPPTVTVDVEGRVKFSGVAEGPYTLEVRSEDHETYRNTLRIEAGELNASEVFISRNLVEYTWTVEEIEIEDRTRIVIDAVFETNVPAPVVTVDGQIDLSVLTEVGQSQQFDFKVTNHGLIAANDAGFNFGSHPFFKIEPLITDIGVLPAKSEITVPVIVTRIGSESQPPAFLAASNEQIQLAEIANIPPDELQAVAAALLGQGRPTMSAARAAVINNLETLLPQFAAAASAISEPCIISAEFLFCYICNEKVCRSVNLPVWNSGCYTPSSPPSPIGRPGGPSGSGGLGGPGGVAATPVGSASIVSCNECIEKMAEAVLKCVDKFLPWRNWVKCSRSGYSCVTSGYEDGLSSGTGYNCFKTVLDCAEAFGRTIPGPWKYLSYVECAYELLTACLEFGPAPSGPGTGGIGAARALSQGLSSDLRSSISAKLGELEQFLKIYDQSIDADTYAYGNRNFLDVETGQELASWMSSIDLATDGQTLAQRKITTAETQSLIDAEARPNSLSDEDINKFADRWNRSMDYWDQGIFELGDVPDGQSTDFIAMDVWRDKLDVSLEGQDSIESLGFTDLTDAIDHIRSGIVEDLAAYASDGVCAQVKLRIEQEAVQTRTAFEATLEISNQTAEALENIDVDVVVLDADGNDVTELFGIQLQSSDLNDVDGVGVLPSQSSGGATWLIIAATEAATDGPTEYFIAGSFRYDEVGITVERTLLPTSITVYPQAELELDYFLQRDVISDDPHTEAIESAQPFTLAVQVQNNGGGAARNLHIESAQPKIIENEKGLLIDFEITGTKVNGGEVERSLTADFGNVEPGAIAIAEWQMESTLQGLFVEYDATFEHISPFGDNRFSLIKSVEIHELIHVTNAEQVDGGDGLPDFLVNDITDPKDLPDTLYLSDSSVMDVNLGNILSSSHTPVLSNLRIDVTADMNEGWSYLLMDYPNPDELMGEALEVYDLIGVERSDGTMLPLENFWQTDRTFVGLGQRPELEDKIHLLDYESTGIYTFVFSNGDLTGPQVVDFTGVVPNPTTETIDVVDVTFTEVLAGGTFDEADLSLTKNGANVVLSGTTIVFVSGTTYRVSGLAPFTAEDAVYELTVNAEGLTDQVSNIGVGTKLFRWVKGETAPTVLALQGAPDGLVASGVESIDVVFSKTIVLATLTTDDLSLTLDDVELIDDQVTISQVGGSTYRIGNLGRLTAVDGQYEFNVDAAGVEDSVGKTGLGESTAAWTLDSTAPQLVDVIDPATNPRNIVVQQIDLVFDEPIDINTLDIGDLMLVRNGGVENLLAGDDRVTFEDRGFNTYRVGGINWVQAFVADPQIADFTFTIDATGITDAAGNVGSGLMSSTWTIDLDKPLAATDLAISTFSGDVVDGLVSSTNATVTGTLAEAGLTVAIRDMTTDTELVRETIVGTAFSLPIEFPSFGQHRLRVRVVDLAGNVADTFIEDLFVTDTPPVVESITGVPDAFSRGAIDAIDVTFVSPVDAATVTKLALNVTRNGGANLVNGTVSVEALADGLTYRFNGLTPITGDEGLYNLDFNFGNVANPSGLRSSESNGFSWRNDTTGPTSSIDRLQFVQELGTFVINLDGADSALATDVPGSGIVAYDLYVSDYRSPFQFMESIPADVATTTFVGEPNQLYVFRVVARDAAGNIESKSNGIDAWTYMPDIFAPITQVDAVDATDATFEIDFSGTDRGKALRAFDLYAQVDGGDVEKVATVDAGSADTDGVYSGSYEYQAISDGTEHDYRFFTVGVDRRGNTELEPDSPADVSASTTFAAPVSTEVVDFDVQKGANQRSFLQYLDVFFNTSDELSGIIASLNDGNMATDRISLTRFALDGSGSGDNVSLAGRISAVDQALELDFGDQGIGGDRNSSLGDGYYSLKLDLDGNGSLETELNFFRLLGDADGDGDADNADLAAIAGAFGQLGSNLDGDLNGDGRVNAFDRLLWFRGRGKSIAPGLPLND